MAGTVRDLMTPDPTTIQANTPLADAARVMRDSDVGALVVLDDRRLAGLVTDRDMVVRAVAESAGLGEIDAQDVFDSGHEAMAPIGGGEGASGRRGVHALGGGQP